MGLVEGQIKEGNIQVEVGSELPIVYGDRIRLIGVVQNLVDNAIKFMGGQSQPLLLKITELE